MILKLLTRKTGVNKILTWFLRQYYQGLEGIWACLFISHFFRFLFAFLSHFFLNSYVIIYNSRNICRALGFSIGALSILFHLLFHLRKPLLYVKEYGIYKTITFQNANTLSNINSLTAILTGMDGHTAPLFR